MTELECDKLIKRDIPISDCKETNPADCNRSYFLHIPAIICEEQNNSTEADGNFITLPLVFAFHCFGCPASAMFTFIQHANEHNFILVVPEGIRRSFNARHCCGYALEHQIDDVGLIKNILLELKNDYKFVNPNLTYAVGWSNGGFMVMHASALFRAIAPISGFIAGISSELREGGGGFGGKPLFIHQGMDDSFVRPTGCCHNPDMPKCCCSIAADTCTDVLDVARDWAVEVNGCPNTEKVLAETSYTNADEGIQCQTSPNCMANTTICTYQHSGHFNSPSFDKAFPMAYDVMDFFARDVCEVNDGRWNGLDKTCSCETRFSGPFCLDASGTSDAIVEVETLTISRAFFVTVIGLAALALAYAKLHQQRRHRTNTRGGKYTKVQYDVEMT